MPPLPRWANPKRGPYTIAVNLELQQEFGVRMSVVTMGPALSKKLAMWGALAHECGHDITIADYGLLEECAKNINSEILKASELQGQEVVYNGSREPLAKRAAEVWMFWIKEVVADVMGILNFGPASGIALSTLLIALRKGKLTCRGSPDDVHPIDALRAFMAADLVREITSLNANIRNGWSEAQMRIIDEYIDNKDKFELGWSISPNQFFPTVEFPFEPMRETSKIVAKTLAFGQLETLE